MRVNNYIDHDVLAIRAEEIRSVSSPKAIHPVITSELVGVATERSLPTERQRIGSQSSSNHSATVGGPASGGDVVGKKPRHYLSGTLRSLMMCDDDAVRVVLKDNETNSN